MELLALTISSFSTFSIFMNLAVIYIILNYSKSIGKYKWVLAGYAAYEAFSAFIVVTVEPIHFVYDNTWIIFSNSHRVVGTEIAKYGTGFYCAVLLVWQAITLFQFIYRYMVICQSTFIVKVKHSSILRFFIIFLATAYSTYFVVCGMYWCRKAEVSQAMKDQLFIHYNVVDIQRHGYMLMRLVDNSGGISAFGTWSTVNHFTATAIAASCVIFCSTSIYLEFKKHSNGDGAVEKIKKERQLFRLLVVQSAIPLFCFSLPGVFYITFPFWDPTSTLGFTAPILTMILSLPKFIDPIVTVLLITEYRRAVKNIIFGRGNGEDATRSTRSTWATATTARKMNNEA